jgi:hypothetical protein
MRSVLSILLCCRLLVVATEGAILAGQPVRGGATLEIHFPVAKSFQDIAAQAGNPRPEVGRAVLTFPVGFDPARNWPIFIVTSTSDFNRTSPMDAQWYREPALAQGWVLLASDATIKPRLDSTQWRLAILAAALESIRREWPQSAKWPVAFGGFSGGAKRSAVLGAMLAKAGSVKICGFFLSGINEDRLSEAYRDYHLGQDFLATPIWLSSGQNDNVAKPQDHDRVKASLERTGFKRVRLERFSGGHQVKKEEVERALHWFREVAKF